MNAPWTPDPCTGQANWKGETVCRRPYGRGAYGMGPYGRCAIIGGVIWGSTLPSSVWSAELACAPVFGPPTAIPYPWRKTGQSGLLQRLLLSSDGRAFQRSAVALSD